ncbi:MAG: FMN-binding protein [Candidatus Scatomorpha sp.]|jgi:uncharacterized protein with FMN-binding domain
MKTLKKIAVILVVLVVIGFLGFKFVSNKIISDAKALSFEEIDSGQLKDGEYLGNYEIFPVKVSVKTWVKNGEITQIDLLEHFNGKGAPAEKIVDDIIEKQSLQVDAVSGATVSSVAIKKAVEDSLLGK